VKALGMAMDVLRNAIGGDARSRIGQVRASPCTDRIRAMSVMRVRSVTSGLG
jgi:hypothetical protein